MDWNLAISRNLEALKCILALLAAMTQMTTDAVAGQGGINTRPTALPRHLHLFVLRVLRPAEAATRRLILIAARGLVVKLAAPRFRKPKPIPQPRTILVLDRVNGSIVSVPIVLPEPVSEPAVPRAARRTLSFPLLDPLPRFGVRRSYARPSVAPHIRSFDGPRGFVTEPTPSPPSADDLLDAGRLHRRLDAIGRALEDLPGYAMRMARWHARRDARLARERASEEDRSAQTGASASQDEGMQMQFRAQRKRRFNRFSPMRPGRPPGWRRRPNHAVHDVLNELHGLAVWARDGPGAS